MDGHLQRQEMKKKDNYQNEANSTCVHSKELAKHSSLCLARHGHWTFFFHSNKPWSTEYCSVSLARHGPNILVSVWQDITFRGPLKVLLCKKDNDKRKFFSFHSQLTFTLFLKQNLTVKLLSKGSVKAFSQRQTGLRKKMYHPFYVALKKCQYTTLKLLFKILLGGNTQKNWLNYRK